MPGSCDSMGVLFVFLYLFFAYLQNKCDQYWPSEGSEQYGSIQVRATGEVQRATYTLRKFLIKKVKVTGTSLNPQIAFETFDSFRFFFYSITVFPVYYSKLSSCLYDVRLKKILETICDSVNNWIYFLFSNICVSLHKCDIFIFLFYGTVFIQILCFD